MYNCLKPSSRRHEIFFRQINTIIVTRILLLLLSAAVLFHRLWTHSMLDDLTSDDAEARGTQTFFHLWNLVYGLMFRKWRLWWGGRERGRKIEINFIRTWVDTTEASFTVHSFSNNKIYTQHRQSHVKWTNISKQRGERENIVVLHKK